MISNVFRMLSTSTNGNIYFVNGTQRHWRILFFEVEEELNLLPLLLLVAAVVVEFVLQVVIRKLLNSDLVSLFELGLWKILDVFDSHIAEEYQLNAWLLGGVELK